MSSCWPVLRKGCCCCTLETCCKVQGYFAMLGGPIGVVTGIFMLSNAGHSKVPDDRVYYLGIGISLIMLSFIYQMMPILFVMGINSRRHELMLPYVVNIHIAVIVSAFKGLLLCFFYHPIVGVLFIVVVTGLTFYCMLCANSLIITIRAEREAKETAAP